MSKSLKNFISIEEFLKTYTANHFRVFCISNKYNSNIEYSEDRMKDASKILLKLKNFFHTVKNIAKFEGNLRWGENEKKLNSKFEEMKKNIHFHLSNDFDTPQALNLLLDIISESNSYLNLFIHHQNNHPNHPSFFLLNSISEYIQNFCSLYFGLSFEELSSNVSQDQQVSHQLIETLIDFRNTVRNYARKKENPSKYFQLCDEIRDKQLPNLGFILEDTPTTTKWKSVEKSGKEN